MTPQSRSTSRWRRIVAGVVVGAGLAASLGLGLGTATANADVLDDLAQEFSLGAGAGPVANWVKQSLMLRSQGYKPRPADYKAIQEALSHRPNQVPLIDALKSTVNRQRKMQSEIDPVTGNPFTIGINALPPGVQPDPQNPNTPGLYIQPGR
jgi:hypothetical protein